MAPVLGSWAFGIGKVVLKRVGLPLTGEVPGSSGTSVQDAAWGPKSILPF